MKRFFHLARFVLEAHAPLMIASGEADPNLDVLLARDANGLPMLPATGIAGALRHLTDDEWCFGDAGNIETTRASDVVFSDGLIHLSDGRPRDGILFNPPGDDLWELYQQPNPIQRDHVKLDERGAAEATAKFQRGAVPAGSRFSGEISMMSEKCDDPDFTKILGLLAHPVFALGGARRSGYGAMGLIKCKTRCFDLSDDEDWGAYGAFRELEFGQMEHLREAEVTCSAQTETKLLALRSEGFVMVGGQDGPIGEVAKTPDQSPYRETRISWKTGTGEEIKSVVIPGSAIRGALRHRTLFYYRRQNPDCSREDTRAATDKLFGAARNEVTGTGGAGKVRVADAVPEPGYDVEAKACILPHVSIDRFTGGANRGALFDAQALWQLQITVKVTLEEGIDETARAALERAIADLKTGHLQIGADGGDGLGVFLEVEAEGEPA